MTTDVVSELGLPGSRPLEPVTYWDESARPWVSLWFIAPMLLIYELGVLLPGPSSIRNGADAWMRTLLDYLGFGQYFLLPVLTCGILLGWHHVRHHQWKFRASVLWGMWLECTMLAAILLLLANWQARWFVPNSLAIPCATNRAEQNLMANIVAYLGAGIYEELLFRLILLPAVVGALRASGLTLRASLISGVILTSLFFSLAHYKLELYFFHWHIGLEQGDKLEWFSFFFRFSAGIFFSALFVLRGFGIAAGTHALYDIMAVIL